MKLQVKRERELAKIRYKLKQQNAVSLEMPAPQVLHTAHTAHTANCTHCTHCSLHAASQLARDFFTDAEMREKAAFKKPKKKKKREGERKSKMLKADDLLAIAAESGRQAFRPAVACLTKSLCDVTISICDVAI